VSENAQLNAFISGETLVGFDLAAQRFGRVVVGIDFSAGKLVIRQLHDVVEGLRRAANLEKCRQNRRASDEMGSNF
jgi:hypothetical protein